MLSCSQRNTGITTIDVDVSTQPLVHGEDVLSLISTDSSGIYYRIEAKVQDYYSNDTTSYWYFPEGIHVEKFDSLFQVNGSVRADTAYNYDKKGLWRLIGNVLLTNIPEEAILKTSELFWNSKEPSTSRESIYTEKYFEFKTPTDSATGVGLKSNLNLSWYTVYQNSFQKEIDEDN